MDKDEIYTEHGLPYGRIERIKNHLSENKQIYIACGVTAVVSVTSTAAILISRKPELVNAKIIQGLALWSPPTLEVHIEALGDPGNIIQDITTGTIYASQGQAARELGIDPARISEHLNGKNPDAGGRIFKKLGKAAVSE